jgi:dual specificity tyrosine-phosphorylation-regulated kinase 2/3/4
VLAELLTGHPLLPGEDEAEQLACIVEVLGLPHPSLLAGAQRANMFFDAGRCLGTAAQCVLLRVGDSSKHSLHN